MIRLAPNFPKNSQVEIDKLELTFVHGSYTEYPIKFYDGSWGPLWIMRDTRGIVGIVRAQTWESAYEICVDEFLPVVPEDDLHEAYDMTREEFAAASETTRSDTGEDWPELIEGYSHQSNSTGTGIVSHDLNGEVLDALTVELAEHLEIKIVLVYKE